MARPAIVIGLGGTGQWVLTYLKKDLIETHQKMPENVRLLAFDTMPEASVQTKGAGKKEKDIALGAVRLERNSEFFGLSGNGSQIGQEVVDGNAPHIGSWFDVRFYRQQQMPALWDLASGAGQVRQFGRLGMFMKIDQAIWNTVQQAFQSLRPMIQKGSELEVAVIASFAGGTGAGMFIDMGIICRQLASIVQNNLIIRGFFVLPRAFIQGGQLGLMDDHMKARSFAAWRELERFMNIGPDYGAPRVTYKPGSQQLSIQLSVRPFDQCYLVDSRRTSHSLENTPPEYGVHPSIADFISTVIDEESGTVYTQDAINLAGVSQAQRSVIGYSALGTYTIKSPIYYAMEEYGLSLAKDVLDLWLVPERDQNGQIFRLAVNQNREAGLGTRQGRDATIEFLQSPTGVERRVQQVKTGVEVTGQATEVIQNTLFFPRMAQIFLQNLKDDGRSIEIDAQGGYTTLIEGQVDPNTYAGTFCTLPSDAGVTRYIYQNRPEQIDPVKVANEIAVSIWDAVPTSKEMNESPADAPVRFDRDIPTFEQTHFGVGGGRGEYGAMLDRVRLFQVARFKEMLQQWTVNVLNGTKGSIVDQRSGKLGFVIDFYQQMIKILDYFVEYVDLVTQRRGTLQLKNSAIQARDAAREEMLAQADKKCIFFFEHPRAHMAQRDYLEAVDQLHMIQKDDMLLATLAQIGLELKEITKHALQSAQRWADTLVLGTSNTPGIYRSVQTELENIRATRAEDEKSSETQLLLQLDSYDKVKKQAEVDEQLSRFEWQVNTENGFEIGCSVLVPMPKQQTDGSIGFVNERRELKLEDTPFVQGQNLRWISSIGRYVYRDEPQRHRAIEEVMRMTEPNFASFELFGRELMERSDPLLELNQTASQTAIVKWLYLRMRSKGISESVSGYTANLNDWMRQHTSSILTDMNHLRFVESENEHKITIIQLWGNIQPSNFTIWKELYDAYRRHILSGEGMETATRLHIFPAECNAASYESRLASMLRHRNAAYRIFHPKVVMLMEDVQRLSLFFRCYAYGYIKSHESEIGERWYSLEVPALGRYVEQSLDLTNPYDNQGQIRDGWPTMLEVLNAFVHRGCDVRNSQNQIAWQDLRNTIVQIERKLREQGQLEEKLKNEINQGLVADLHKKADEMKREERRRNKNVSAEEWGWASGQEYDDLADLAEMMYLEVLKNQTPELRDKGGA